MEQLKTVVDKIYEQTARKALKWKPTQQGSLRVDFARSSIEISEQARSEGISPYILRIYNNTGAVIATIDQTFEEGAEAKLSQLFADAYNSAFEIDSTVQDLLAGLASRSAAVKSGFYKVNFTSPQSGIIGEGIAIVGEGKINGGDQGYLYRGSYYVTADKLSGTLNIKQWNPNVVSIFGPLREFDLNLAGRATADGRLTIEGNVTQQPDLRIKIDARWIENTA